MPWLSGTYVTLEYPLPYMGFVVSANRHVSQFENGRLKNFGVLDSYDSRFAAFERGSSFVISLDGPWYQKLAYTMRLFSYESRHYLPQDATQKAKAGISFDLLLTIDRQGRLGVEVLRPKQLSEAAFRHGLWHPSTRSITISFLDVTSALCMPTTIGSSRIICNA